MTGRPPLSIPDFDTLSLDTQLVQDLRSDHAGETGAVSIYRGILAVKTDQELREFAREHLATERRHLHFFDAWLPAEAKSRLLPLWQVAGWLLGALPAFFGRRAVYQTISAVESFVEGHYQDQIRRLAGDRELTGLRLQLEHFCAEEVEHGDDAAGRAESTPGRIGRVWTSIVAAGSAAGVWAARAI